MLIGIIVNQYRAPLASIGTNPAARLERNRASGGEVAEDWAAVGSAISDRLAELRTTQMDVAARAQISLTTLRELQHNTSPRQRRPQTLSAVSEALGWPADYLARVLRGENARPHPDEEHDPVLTSLTSVERELGELRDRVDRIERQLAGEGG
jgi:transcriptional regulator with XRE-family HTH domain